MTQFRYIGSDPDLIGQTALGRARADEFALIGAGEGGEL